MAELKLGKEAHTIANAVSSSSAVATIDWGDIAGDGDDDEDAVTGDGDDAAPRERMRVEDPDFDVV